MQAEVNRYRLAPRGHPDHSYKFLLGALQRQVQLYRQDRNREDFLKGLQTAAGGQQKALPAAELDAFPVQGGKGKKVCWHFQKGSCVRENCQFAHVKPNEQSGGKGKAAGPGTFVPTCRHFALKAKCQYGDKCKFRHAQSEGTQREGVSGLVSTELDNNVDGVAFVACSTRSPTPPPVESNEFSQFSGSCCNNQEGCSVRDGEVHETCYAIGTSIARSACSDQCDSTRCKWIIDSGAGLDLISNSQLQESELHTMSRCANGC
eukprot:4781812-Amphidinium_carterae.7